MRAGTFGCAVLALALVAGVGSLRGNSSRAAKVDRVAALIKRLGDSEFARREAASKELEDLGEPAIAALRQAATSSDDLEIRRRAERIIQTIAARAADAAIKRELAAVKGKWNVEFTNGVTEVCDIFNFDGGHATVDEPRRRSRGTVVVQGGSVVITFNDDRVERWTAVGKRFVVEHWFPGSRFPTTNPVLGIAERTR
jgi:hypothetical protein